MPYLPEDGYRSPFYLFNGHLQTIVPSLMRRVAGVAYRRERIATPDDDFLDLDWSPAAPDGGPRRLAIVSHGLEGDSRRPYMLGMVRALNAAGYDALAWNYRSCSGEMNRQRRFYHLGATDDLHTVVRHALAAAPYAEAVLVGFSAGGNLTLKYLGEQAGGLAPQVRRAAVFSVPLDMVSSCAKISQPQNFIYERRFLRSLRGKIMRKAQLMPGQIDPGPLRHIRSLRQFDDHYTAPLHGFRDATDYYNRCGSRHFLAGIAVPTLIVNAANDPFLTPQCLDQELVRRLPHVWLQVTRAGGHCGFVYESLQNAFWSENRVLSFLAEG